jgi:membrane protease YdiL (CAAX protease family)
LLSSLLRETGAQAWLSETFVLFGPPVLALPLQLASALFVLWRVRGTLPYQVGLSAHRWQRNAQAGALVCLILTPVAYGVFLAAVWLNGGDEKHPLDLLAQGPISPADRVLIALVAVVAAPVWEEFLFRGVLLFWAARRSWRSEIVMVIALLLALAFGLAPRTAYVGTDRPWYEQRAEPKQDFEGILKAPAEADQPEGQGAGYHLLVSREGRQVPQELYTGPSMPASILKGFAGKKAKVTGKMVRRPDTGAGRAELWVGSVELLDRTWLEKLAPGLFVLLMFPGYLVLPWLARWGLQDVNVARAIYATALLFGIMHSPVWPSPIPLFVLGLGLGWLAYRTQNLVAPIVLHGLFNGVGCVQLFWGGGG